MIAVFGWLRRQLPGVVALIVMVSLFYVVKLPEVPAAEKSEMARKFAFSPMSIAMPGGFKQKTIRKVNKDYKHIDAWISSVGAGIAMNDLDGDGLTNDLCITDPRTDQVVVTPTPGARANRYAAFALSSGTLPMNDVMAPMGCNPGDFNEDGRTDLLVYMWGRTPIVYLARTDAKAMNADAFQATELLAGPNGTATYTGAQWNTNAVAVDDFDGDGHIDIYIGNYFPHGPVLDSKISGGVSMNRSMSAAHNGGEDYFFRFAGATAGPKPTINYERVDDVLPDKVSKGWTLAAAATDMDGDSLPELYLGHDFGQDRLLYNRSTPGRLKFSTVSDTRKPFVPKSLQVGRDSFKGMGVDFGDLNGDGIYDMFVSNITTTFGLQESNFAFISTSKDQTALRGQLVQDRAPWEERSASLGLAWTGWGWDTKIADFNNSGVPAIAQANGFVKGEVNRWPQLQELAVANDNVLDNPYWWPHAKAGDDIAGSQRLHFYVKSDGGRYANLAHKLGLDVPVPTRGIATGDADGDGRLEFAVARQWDEPVFYHNDSPSTGSFLELCLMHDTKPVAGKFPGPGSPVVGAQVTVTTPDGHRYIQRVDGGSGHSGRRSNEIHIGLGKNVTGPVKVHLRWRDRNGQIHNQDLQMAPGRHMVTLGSQAKER